MDNKKPSAKDVLSQKQLDFCIYYIETNHTTQSAIRAGYSEKTAAQKTKDARKNARDQQDMKDNIKHAKETGKTLDGKKAGKKDIRQMQHALRHMQNDGMNKKDAMKAAKMDMKQDKRDAAHRAKNKEGALRNPPPGRRNSNGNSGNPAPGPGPTPGPAPVNNEANHQPLPANQNDQVDIDDDE